MNRPAIIRLDGWAGQREVRVLVVGETPQKYRVTPAGPDPIMLAGRKKYLLVGCTMLVPKRVVEFLDDVTGAPAEVLVQPGSALPKLIQVSMNLHEHNLVNAAIAVAFTIAETSKPSDEFIQLTNKLRDAISEFVSQSYDANDRDGRPVYSRVFELAERMKRLSTATWQLPVIVFETKR